MKLCPRCQETKPDDAFYRVDGGRHLDSKCKECKREVHRQWKATPRGREMIRAAKRNYRQTEGYRRYKRTPGFVKRYRRYKAKYSRSLGGTAKQREWRATAKGRAVQARRNAVRRMHLGRQEATLTAIEWMEMKNRAKGKCYYCGKRRRLTQDHVIPLCKGGGHTKANVVPACLPCNVKKGAKIVTLF